MCEWEFNCEVFKNCLCENGRCMSVSESRKLSLNVKVWDNVEDLMKCEHGGLLCTWNKIELSHLQCKPTKSQFWVWLKLEMKLKAPFVLQT
jgi:hypothetical protein